MYGWKYMSGNITSLKWKQQREKKVYKIIEIFNTLIPDTVDQRSKT